MPESDTDLDNGPGNDAEDDRENPAKTATSPTSGDTAPSPVEADEVTVDGEAVDEHPVPVSARVIVVEEIVDQVPDSPDGGADLDAIAQAAVEGVADYLGVEVPDDAQADVVKGLRTLAYQNDQAIVARQAVDSAARVLTP